ncbi:MAG TPA: hypothetical protein VGP26_17675 [Actinophytocola sp.]|jgi:hypothetical protein|nr:hypothetical protein [Actinophytocola sp.]
MSDLTALSTESVKGLGAGAYLVNVLPGAVLIISIVALADSRLLPWSQPRIDHGTTVPAGPASVYDAFEERGIVGAVVLVLATVVLAVLLRPFQVRTVQFLEGYWRRGGLAKALAVERHTRNAAVISARRYAAPPLRPHDTDFAVVARFARRRHRAKAIANQAVGDWTRYPTAAVQIMPTALGNVLRRAESTAGERYGLRTVDTYRRLHPHLSSALDAEINAQLNAIDSMSTFVLVFTVQVLASAALVARWDWWSLLPVALLVLAMLAYRGAVVAARDHGVLLATAYDLHRWDMLSAMHLPLPTTGDAEIKLNRRLSDLMTRDGPLPAEEQRTWRYAHPPDSPPVDGSTAG